MPIFVGNVSSSHFLKNEFDLHSVFENKPPVKYCDQSTFCVQSAAGHAPSSDFCFILFDITLFGVVQIKYCAQQDTQPGFTVKGQVQTSNIITLDDE